MVRKRLSWPWWARPDLILMDLMMPVMGGATAAKIIKSSPRTADIPIVALTAHPRSDLPYFDQCLIKPCPASMILATVNGYCTRVAA